MTDGVRMNVHRLSGARQRQCPNPRRRRTIGVLSAVVIAVAITVAIAAAPATLEPQATYRRNIDLVNIGVTVAGEGCMADGTSTVWAVLDEDDRIVVMASGADAAAFAAECAAQGRRVVELRDDSVVAA